MYISCKVLDNRKLSSFIFALRVERKFKSFIPGQTILLGLPNEAATRPYSIYSGDQEPYIEVLIKAIPNGFLSNRFCNLKENDYIRMSPPFGGFTINNFNNSYKYILISNGTGIAPFHCFIKSFKFSELILIHGQ